MRIHIALPFMVIGSNKIYLDKKEKVNQGEILNETEIENLKKRKK